MPGYINITLTAGFCIAVIYLASEDHRSNRLPDWVTLPLVGLGLVINLFEGFVPFSASLLGAGIGFVGIQTVRIWQIHRRNFSGIGFGDAKYLCALGAWLGHQNIAPLLVGASVLTLLLYPRRTQKPFGVGLGISALGVMNIPGMIK